MVAVYFFIKAITSDLIYSNSRCAILRTLRIKRLPSHKRICDNSRNDPPLICRTVLCKLNLLVIGIPKNVPLPNRLSTKTGL